MFALLLYSTSDSIHLFTHSIKMTFIKTALTVGFLCFSFTVFTQTLNDDCPNLINLGEAPICPILDTFTNVNATASVVFSNPVDELPPCFIGSSPNTDVWFQFIPPTDGSITDFEVILTGVNGQNGPIVQPQIAVYRGDCLLDELQLLACGSALAGSSELTVLLEGLTAGLTYFLRIEDWSATATSNWGDFELCIKEPDLVFVMGEDTESSACEGTLFDSGGADGDYSNNENNVFTICPNTQTGCINLEFPQNVIENNFDFLNIYEGMGLNGPLVAAFTGTTPATSLQIGNNCVTVQFTSDISVTNPGFEMIWACEIDPCLTTFEPCGLVETIFGLPFTNLNATTCGAGDDVQDGPCELFDEVLNGEDYVYTYTPVNDGCIDIMITGANLNTGLSVYDACPEFANECIGQTMNALNDTLLLNGLEVSSFNPIFISVSNGDACTDYQISIMDVECEAVVAANPFCEDAFILNRCTELPDLFNVNLESNSIDAYFQENINDGCWEDDGAAHFTWLFFQAQIDGNFGFLAQNANPLELADVNIQVWGPITNPDEICLFMTENQPIRSTGATSNVSAGNPDLTGLIDMNPVNGIPITDECEGSAGDGFVSLLPVEMDAIYLILINDFSGNVINGGLSLDFSATTPGVLNGLPDDSPLQGDEYITIGTAFYNPINQDFSCIQITDDGNTQLGCAWQPDPIDFSEPFSVTYTAFFGNNDGGADGICMVFQNSPDGTGACGISGGEIGAGGITNSLIVEFDTWQNVDFNDPFQDHIAVNINGVMDTPIAGPTIVGNLENGQEYNVTFSWEPSTNAFQVFLDGALQVSGTVDVINDLFNGSTTAYYGFTGSTGGANNLQYVCTGDQIFPASKTDTLIVQICEGESIFAGGASQTTTGIYTDVFTTFTGCDSTIVTDLTVNPTSNTDVSVVLCMGETIFVGGANQNTAGVYVDMFTSSNGCDSLVSTDLSFLDNSFANEMIEACEGTPVFVGGDFQTTSGVYTDTFVAANGCDSIISTELTFVNVIENQINIAICEGESFFVGGMNQTITGIYLDTLQSNSGCDSIITTNLEVLSFVIDAFAEDMLNCQNDSVTINAQNSEVTANSEIQWIAPDGSIVNTGNSLLLVATQTGDYTFSLTNTTNGTSCTQTTIIPVLFDESFSCIFGIPNAFTPNGDDSNDVFQIVDEAGINTVRSLVIYNRWGNEVHNGSGDNHGWNGEHDGSAAPADVYIYRFEIEDSQGNITIESGDVTLIR